MGNLLTDNIDTISNDIQISVLNNLNTSRPISNYDVSQSISSQQIITDENETYLKTLHSATSHTDSKLCSVLKECEQLQLSDQIRSHYPTSNNCHYDTNQPSPLTNQIEPYLENPIASLQNQTNECDLLVKLTNLTSARSQSVPEINSNQLPTATVHRLSAPAIMALPVQLQNLQETKTQFLHRHQKQYNKAKVRRMKKKAQLKQEMNAFLEEQEMLLRNYLQQATASELDDEWDRLKTALNCNNDNDET